MPTMKNEEETFNRLRRPLIDEMVSMAIEVASKNTTEAIIPTLLANHYSAKEFFIHYYGNVVKVDAETAKYHLNEWLGREAAFLKDHPGYPND